MLRRKGIKVGESKKEDATDCDCDTLSLCRKRAVRLTGLVTIEPLLLCHFRPTPPTPPR